MKLLVDVSAGIAIAASEKERVTLEIFTRYGDQLPGRFAVYQGGRLHIR
ncbi:MAG TPA: hypothetical protein VH592_15715 [Gemmataceae bacterium]|jgi:hypothetical protein